MDKKVSVSEPRKIREICEICGQASEHHEQNKKIRVISGQTSEHHLASLNLLSATSNEIRGIKLYRPIAIQFYGKNEYSPLLHLKLL